jgi:hypothetical protein
MDQQQDKSNSEHHDTSLDKHHASQQGDVIYVLRTAQQHHAMLGMIADQKANILLGAFFIYITVTQTC